VILSYQAAFGKTYSVLLKQRPVRQRTANLDVCLGRRDRQQDVAVRIGMPETAFEAAVIDMRIAAVSETCPGFFLCSCQGLEQGRMPLVVAVDKGGIVARRSVKTGIAGGRRTAVSLLN